MATTGLVTDLVNELSLTAETKWEDVSLFTPYLHDQALLYEFADCLAAQTFLRMAQLPYSVKQRPNAEFISSTGHIPFLKTQKLLVSGFSNIVEFVSRKGVSLSSDLQETQIAEMRAQMAVIDHLLRNVEIYLVWKHDETYRSVTKARYGSVYYWPLSYVLPTFRRRDMLTKLQDAEWRDKTMEEVVEQSEKAFRSLSFQLGTNPFLFGDSPTEADALMFGHLFTILTVRLPAMDVFNLLKKFPNLIEFTQRVNRDFFKQ
ncbi:unnamed protein product [Auanema sp. JU1783]|nr:unnamed protein product [Auanema sp. JU1783]